MKKFFSNPVWNPCTRFLFYFAFILIIGYLITWADKYPDYLIHQQMSSGEMVGQRLSIGLAIAIFCASYSICTGLLLAMPSFISKVKMQGAWRFDWIKFLAIGIPTFYCTIAPVVLWAPVVGHPLLPWAMLLPYPLCGFIFGYVLLNSFEKVSTSSSTLSEADDFVHLQ